MNNPVSFETAKLLKEKGFDEQNLTIYQDGEIILLKSTISNSQFMTSRNYTAPTIAEVVMWLYEKHGIWIFAFSYSRRWQWKIDSDSSTAEYSRGDGFNSPTEAYEEAISYSLKNLIK